MADDFKPSFLPIAAVTSHRIEWRRGENSNSSKEHGSHARNIEQSLMGPLSQDASTPLQIEW